MRDSDFHASTQSILSLGYLYLIIMGMFNEVLYYNQLDVEILKYSSILDIIVSPLTKISNTVGMVFFLVLIVCIIFLPAYLAGKREKNWFKKAVKLEDGLDVKGTASALSRTLIFLAALGISGFFVGTGIGGGFKIAQDIKNEEIEFNDKIHFVSGEISNIALLGKNSSYVFYKKEGNKNVLISPISGVIKSIEEVVMD